MKHVLIVDDVHPILIEELEKIGYDVDYRPEIKAVDVKEIIGNFSGLVVRSKLVIDAAFLSNCHLLQFIARAGAGLDQLDVRAIEAKGIEIVNAPEGNRNALAEHMLGMLLSLFHKLPNANTQVRNTIWDREGNRGTELRGKTVGIVGYGYMGSAFAEKLASFGCRVLAYDISKRGYSSPLVSESSMEEIYQQADVLSLHVPLTDRTIGLVSADYISRFRKPFYLLNSARGKVMKTMAVIDALNEGKLLGACLDVLENEKFGTYSENDLADFQELISFPQVILSPHVAGWTVESYEEISRVLAHKIQALELP